MPNFVYHEKKKKKNWSLMFAQAEIIFIGHRYGDKVYALRAFVGNALSKNMFVVQLFKQIVWTTQNDAHGHTFSFSFRQTRTSFYFRQSHFEKVISCTSRSPSFCGQNHVAQLFRRNLNVQFQRQVCTYLLCARRKVLKRFHLLMYSRQQFYYWMRLCLWPCSTGIMNAQGQHLLKLSNLSKEFSF